MFRPLVSIVVIAALFVTMIPGHVQAKTNSNEYVRTASIFLMSGPVLDQNLSRLEQFDLIVIPVEAQVYNQPFFSNIRKLNPDIVILPYVATVSWNDVYWTDPLHQEMHKNIKPEWWLKDGSGQQLSVWPNTRALNLNSEWVTYLASHVNNDVLSTGFWDGVFYDEVQDSISWLGNADVNRDGQNDTASDADALWAANYKKLFEITRTLIGPGSVLITNGTSNSIFSPFVNGRMFETFPSAHSSLTDWKNNVNQYLALEKTVGHDPIQIINASGSQNDYQAMRFGLTTTLLGNGYFSFDPGPANHAVIWDYDEFDVFLGAPKSGPIVNNGVWQRDFAQGKIFVNATDQEYTLALGGDFERLHGTQDPKTNDGSISSDVTIPARNGIVLLRPIEEINDAAFLNGAFARIFSASGEQKRTGFFAYESTFRGGMQIIRFDTDDDGERETVVANESHVSIYETDGSLHVTFAPYGETYKKGINISLGDIENDGSVEIVTGTENGGGAHVRVFNKDGVLINPGFFAYAKNFRGGVNVSIGDLNGDGIKEIICGAGYGGGPHVRVFNKNGKLINPGFFAYENSFRGGVNVSVADMDGDHIDEIVTGPGLGGSPLARVYDKDGKKKSEFYVFDKKEKRGLEIVASDIDGDGKAEVIGLTTNVFTLSSFTE